MTKDHNAPTEQDPTEMRSEMATPMQAEGQDFATATYAQAEKKSPPQPVDDELARELSQRAERAAAEASWHEEQANRWRRYQAACEQGLNCVGDQPVQVPTGAYR